jgi:cell division protein FtsW (lipid II flippase)
VDRSARLHPSSLIAFVTGVLLVVESDFYEISDDWIVLGLVLYATTFLAGLLFLGPESGRIGKLKEEGSPEVGPRMLRLIMLARLDLVLLFGIIFVMAVKPDFGDSALLVGLIAAVLAAGLVYWRYKVALSQPPPGPRHVAGTPTEPG